MATVIQPADPSSDASESDPTTGNLNPTAAYDAMGNVHFFSDSSSEGAREIREDPDEMLQLAESVYEGLSDEEIRQVEDVASGGPSWRGEQEDSGDNG